MAKHKVVKAKVKVSNEVVKPVAVKQGELVVKQSRLVTMPKAAPLPIDSNIMAFVYPNKGKYEIDSVKVNLNGKDQVFTALTMAKLDIQALKLNDLIKDLFVNLKQANIDKFQFGYKNAYNFAFGIVPKGFTSYKCVVAHHNGDGARSLILNSNKHFGMTEIEKTLVKLSISFENHKTYVKVYLSKENLANVIKACQSLVECSAVG